MDKKIMLAVAGAGKTTYLINKLNLEDKFLIVTYTINNLENIRKVVLRKFGCVPDNITLLSFYSFLYSYCCKPFVQRIYKIQGIYWKIPPSESNYFKRTDARFYMTSNRFLYHNRISKLLELDKLNAEINQRLEKYFDHIFFDEIQDFGGHDFNFLMNLCSANLNILMVGDFYQHTFDTSRDGPTNRTLHKDLNKYCSRFSKIGVNVDQITLDKSHRCSESVCNFITNKIGIPITSHRAIETDVLFIEDKNSIEEIYHNDEIVKLFYQESYKYDCYSRNWGEVKGENRYNDVCVVLNKSTFKFFKEDNLENLNSQTKNKLYVACSRSKKRLIFIEEVKLKSKKNSHWV